MNLTSLLPRIQSLLTKPKETWPVIAEEPETPPSLLTGLILPLAAIPAIATFIGLVVVGISVPLLGNVRLGVGDGLVSLLLQLAMSIGGVFLTALIVDALAPTFGGEKNFVQSLKLSAYSAVPGCLAGILAILPSLAPLALVGAIYGLVLLFIGLPILKKCPLEKHVAYFVVALVSVIIVHAVTMTIVRQVAMPAPKLDVDASQLMKNAEQFGKNMEQLSNKALEEANRQMEEMRKAAEEAGKNR